MFRWDQALRGNKILSRAAKAEFYKPALRSYALGWFVRRTGTGLRVSHGGGVKGIVVHYVRLLDENIVVAVVCSYSPKEHPQRLAESLISIARRAR